MILYKIDFDEFGNKIIIYFDENNNVILIERYEDETQIRKEI